jgi:hypothetical protein
MVEKRIEIKLYRVRTRYALYKSVHYLAPVPVYGLSLCAYIGVSPTVALGQLQQS